MSIQPYVCMLGGWILPQDLILIYLTLKLDHGDHRNHEINTFTVGSLII